MDHLSPVRQEGESFENYKQRMKVLKVTEKIYKRGYFMSFGEHLEFQKYAQDERRRNKETKGRGIGPN